jgi:hypothetical protein
LYTGIITETFKGIPAKGKILAGDGEIPIFQATAVFLYVFVLGRTKERSVFPAFQAE